MNVFCFVLGLSFLQEGLTNQSNPNAGLLNVTGLLNLDSGLDPDFDEDALFSSTQLSDLVQSSPSVVPRSSSGVGSNVSSFISVDVNSIVSPNVSLSHVSQNVTSSHVMSIVSPHVASSDVKDRVSLYVTNQDNVVVSQNVTSHINVVSPSVSSHVNVVSSSVSSHVNVVSPSVSSHVNVVSSSVLSHVNVVSPSVSSLVNVVSPSVSSHVNVVSPSVWSHVNVVSPSVTTHDNFVSPIVSSTNATQVRPFVSSLESSNVSSHIGQTVLSHVGQTVPSHVRQTVSSHVSQYVSSHVDQNVSSQVSPNVSPHGNSGFEFESDSIFSDRENIDPANRMENVDVSEDGTNSSILHDEGVDENSVSQHSDEGGADLGQGAATEEEGAEEEGAEEEGADVDQPLEGPSGHSDSNSEGKWLTYSELMLDSYPAKSKIIYLKAYKMFERYLKSMKQFVPNLAPTEIQILNYIHYLKHEKNMAPTTLWSTYSRVNACVKRLFGFSLKSFVRVSDVLKSYESGYKVKKASIFTPQEVHISIKVTLICCFYISFKMFSFYLKFC